MNVLTIKEVHKKWW